MCVSQAVWLSRVLSQGVHLSSNLTRFAVPSGFTRFAFRRMHRGSHEVPQQSAVKIFRKTPDWAGLSSDKEDGRTRE
jgi:hypothetical protein